MPRFPFSWGAAISTGTVVVAPPTPPFWTVTTPDGLRWLAVTTGLIPRFEHLYPQQSGGAQQFVKLPPPSS